MNYGLLMMLLYNVISMFQYFEQEMLLVWAILSLIRRMSTSRLRSLSRREDWEGGQFVKIQRGDNGPSIIGMTGSRWQSHLPSCDPLHTSGGHTAQWGTRGSCILYLSSLDTH